MLISNAPQISHNLIAIEGTLETFPISSSESHTVETFPTEFAFIVFLYVGRQSLVVLSILSRDLRQVLLKNIAISPGRRRVQLFPFARCRCLFSV